MSTLLLIHSYPGANDTVARHFPYYQKAGADLICGVGTTDGKCVWPDEIDFSTEIGENCYIKEGHLCRRLIDTFRFCLLLPFDSFCLIEYDEIFLKPLPPHPGGCLVTHKAGGQALNCRGGQLFHGPWWPDKQTAKLIVEGGDQLLTDRQFEGGSPDCFLGWLCERFSIPVNTTLVPTYSRNSLDIDWQMAEAIQAVKDGVTCVHGVKSKDQLDRLLAL